MRKADDVIMDQMEWSALSPEDKKKQLYLQQKDLLDKLLERNAISQAEYDKSFGDLTRKMGMEKVLADIIAVKGQSGQ